MEIPVVPPQIVITPAMFPKLIYGQPFEIEVSSSLPGTVEVTGLPPGLTATTLSDHSARVSGTPTLAGTFSVQAKVTVGTRNGTLTYPVTVGRGKWLLLHSSINDNPGPVSAFDMTATTPAAATVLSGITIESPPVWAPDGRGFSSITYDSSESKYQILYTAMLGVPQPNPTIANVYGVHPGAIVGDAEPINAVYWSPDGNRFAYFVAQPVSPSVDTGETLYVVDFSNGSPSAPVKIGAPVAGSAITGVQWSPNGARLAYTANEEFGAPSTDHLFVVSFGGAMGPARKRVTPALLATSDVARFEWSPDSELLAYELDDTVDDELHIWAARSLYATVENILVSGVTGSLGPVSPDSTMLAYAAPVAGQGNGLFVGTISGGPSSSIRVSEDLLATEGVGEAQWSPTGLLYSVEDYSNGHVSRHSYAAKIFISSPQFTQDVTVAGGQVFAMLTGDGKNVVAHEGGSIFQRPVSNLATSFEIDTDIVSFSAFLYSSPDARRFTYVEPQAGDQSQKLFTFEQGGLAEAWPIHQVNTQSPALLGPVRKLRFGAESSTIAFRQDEGSLGHIYVTELIGDGAYMTRELTTVDVAASTALVLQPTPR